MPSHANPILWIEKAEIVLPSYATASRRCIRVVNKARRRSTSCITPATVERVVAEYTKFITRQSLRRKNCVDWINNNKLCYRRGTAQCVVSVEILAIATQQCRNYLYNKSWTNRSYEVGGLRTRACIKIWNLQRLMSSRYPGHWSCSLNRLAAEYMQRLTILESSSWRAIKTGRRVADHADVESAYGAFPLNCSFTATFLHVCVCVRHLRLLAEWSTETITSIVPRQHELSWMLDFRIPFA